MQYKKYNVSKPRKELLKNGEEKTFWDNVGTFTLFIKDDGTESGILDLVSFDKSVRLNVFPFKVKETNNYSQPGPTNDYSQPGHKDAYSQPRVEDLGEEIIVESIPF